MVAGVSECREEEEISLLLLKWVVFLERRRGVFFDSMGGSWDFMDSRLRLRDKTGGGGIWRSRNALCGCTSSAPLSPPARIFRLLVQA